MHLMGRDNPGTKNPGRAHGVCPALAFAIFISKAAIRNWILSTSGALGILGATYAAPGYNWSGSFLDYPAWIWGLL
jgi:hypothetical protein